MRGRAARRVSEELHDTMHKLLIRLGLDLNPIDESEADEPDASALKPSFDDGSIEVPRLGHLPDEAQEVLRNQDAYTFPLPQEHTILQMVEGVPDAAEYFIDARWALVRTKDRAFLTSDEPISLARTVTPQNQHFALGLSNAELIQVPLSPELCLVFDRTDRDGPDLAFDAPPSAVEEANQLTVRGHWQQLFRHPDGPPFPARLPPLPDRFVEIR